MDKKDMEQEIRALRDKGAEIVVASIHWGVEGSYRPQKGQNNYAYAAIDAGADIVYGHHPHVLQPIEEYNDGIIYYSLGNFSFGGHHWPRDLDSAMLQQEIIRDPDGTVSLGELTIIPVSCSSLPAQNNFQPTPYEEGSDEYNRVISKLDGSFKGYDLTVNYG
jgi:poly-gamma-glutamate synthesis protein (capsule biosynthesis protein)